MEVILLEKVHNLGDLGERVSVKGGYGRNYLIPKGRALPATPSNIEIFEQRRAELEKQAADSLSAAQSRAKKLEGMKITVAARTAQENKLYGSVGPHEIADAISAEGVEVEKSEVLLPTGGTIREIGEYEISVQLHPDVEVPIVLVVEAQSA